MVVRKPTYIKWWFDFQGHLQQNHFWVFWMLKESNPVCDGFWESNPICEGFSETWKYKKLRGGILAFFFFLRENRGTFFYMKFSMLRFWGSTIMGTEWNPMDAVPLLTEGD